MDYEKIFREMWAWVVENPGEYKHDWPGLAELGKRLTHDCPACEVAETRLKEYQTNKPTKKATGPGPEDMCDFCPLIRSAKEVLGGDADDDDCLHGLYSSYLSISSFYRRSKELSDDQVKTEEFRRAASDAARKILNLEWRA